ncbi:MAG: glycosyltransferase family 9 protein [Planctomycetota bacterium]|jgi:ADP-heptose:LPS heptosyltransferase
MNLGFAKWIDRVFGRLVCILLSACRMMREMVAPREGPVGDPGRILLIKFWGLGNLVMLLPVFRALRLRYPGARIELLTLARNRSLLEGVEDLDGVLVVEDGSLLSVLRTYFGALLAARRGGRPDIVVDFEQFARASAIFAFLTGATHCVGLDTAGQGRGGLFHARVSYVNDQHASETFMDLVRAAGCETSTYEPLAPPIFEADREVVRDLLEAQSVSANDPVVVLHPGSGDNFLGRRWSTARFAALADRLAEAHGARVFVTGTGSEEKLVAEVMGNVKRGSEVHGLAGRLSIREMAALCERAAVVVSNDTAPVHIASALGIPVLGIYGPNTPVIYGPLSAGSVAFYHRTPCSPCLTNFNYKTSLCRMPVCIRSVTVDDVSSAADRVLEQQVAGDVPVPMRIASRDIPGPWDRVAWQSLEGEEV